MEKEKLIKKTYIIVVQLIYTLYICVFSYHNEKIHCYHHLLYLASDPG